jgi:hypothetical protein
MTIGEEPQGTGKEYVCRYLYVYICIHMNLMIELEQMNMMNRVFFYMTIGGGDKGKR